MRRRWVFLPVLLAATLWGGALYAGSEPAATPSTPPTASAPPAQGELPLVLSIRAMSLNPTTLGDTGDIDRVKQQNGGGTTRWPSPNTPIARGVYFSMSPSCIPGVDEPFFPGTQRSSAARRH
jgi:hypothetical protein